MSSRIETNIFVVFPDRMGSEFGTEIPQNTQKMTKMRIQ